MIDQKTVLFYGSSGSGKGTQATLVKEYLEKTDPEHGVVYIETGQELRRLAKGFSVAARATKQVMDEGKLMPSFIPAWAWTDVLVRDYTGNEHLILDGLARRYEEAIILEEALKFFCRGDVTIIVLNVPKEWAVEKLMARGRSDDNEEDIRNRLDWYDENVLPAINYFKEKSDFKVVDIDGSGTIEEVKEKVFEALNLKDE